LQGLGGLQLQEALRLNWDRVDLERGLVEISGELKNDYRERVIPVCSMLLDILKRADERRRSVKVQTLGHEDPVVPNPSGFSFVRTHGSWKNYANRLRKAIHAWNPKLDWTPKDLRNCLPTLAELEGVGGTIFEQYIGHSPKTITERHYVPRIASVTEGEEDELDRQMQHFRRLVVDHIECKMARKGHDTGIDEQSPDPQVSSKVIKVSG
jgi:integrase